MNFRPNTSEDTIATDATPHRGRPDGFTLIEILIAIVLVGILSAVAVVGISNLVSKGTTSACAASADSAKAASAVYFSDKAAYPTTLTQLTGALTGGAPPALTLPTGVTVNTTTGMATTGASWTLTMTVGSPVGAAPTFACS